MRCESLKTGQKDCLRAANVGSKPQSGPHATPRMFGPEWVRPGRNPHPQQVYAPILAAGSPLTLTSAMCEYAQHSVWRRCRQFSLRAGTVAETVAGTGEPRERDARAEAGMVTGSPRQDASSRSSSIGSSSRRSHAGTGLSGEWSGRSLPLRASRSAGRASAVVPTSFAAMSPTALSATASMAAASFRASSASATFAKQIPKCAVLSTRQ